MTKLKMSPKKFKISDFTGFLAHKKKMTFLTYIAYTVSFKTIQAITFQNGDFNLNLLRWQVSVDGNHPHPLVFDGLPDSPG